MLYEGYKLLKDKILVACGTSCGFVKLEAGLIEEFAIK